MLVVGNGKTCKSRRRSIVARSVIRCGRRSLLEKRIQKICQNSFRTWNSSIIKYTFSYLSFFHSVVLPLAAESHRNSKRSLKNYPVPSVSNSPKKSAEWARLAAMPRERAVLLRWETSWLTEVPSDCDSREATSHCSPLQSLTK